MKEYLDKKGIERGENKNNKIQEKERKEKKMGWR